LKNGAQSGENFGSRIRPDTFIALDPAIPLLSANFYRNNLFIESPGCLGCRCSLLGTGREFILNLPADLPTCRDIFPVIPM
jgi:hypothetical protein